MAVDVFLSYAHIDDLHDGAVSALCRALQAEMSMRLGRNVAVFQDTSIAAGERWRVLVAEGLNASAVMICVVTPSFLASRECRDEFNAFTSDESRQRRANAIIPLYYLTSPLIEHAAERTTADTEDPATRTGKAFASQIVERQLTDIRVLRLVPPNEFLLHDHTRKIVHRIAHEIVQHLSRSAARSQEIVVVNQERGPYRTIGDAIERAEPGATISINGGLYQESIVIRKPVRLTGNRSPRPPILTTSGGPVITSIAGLCIVENIVVRAQRAAPSHAVVVSGGRLELAGCDISGSEYACVIANTGAELRLHGCKVHGSNQSGILIHGGSAWIDGCRIYRNTHLGILVERQGVGYITGNIIRACRVGVQYTDDASGMARDNQISRNEYAGFHITAGADPVILRNTIEFNDSSGERDRCGGIFVYQPDHRDRPGRGRLIRNVIRRNSGAGIEIRNGAAPTVYRNVVENNRVGLWAHLGARGTITRNQFIGNHDGNLRLEDAAPALSGNLEVEAAG